MIRESIQSDHPLRAFRRRMDWGVGKLAERAEVCLATIHDTELGRSLPTLRIAYRILRAAQKADPASEWTIEKLFPEIPEVQL